MVDYRGSAGRGQLFVPAHPLQENLLVSQTQEISQTAIERDVPSYTSQAEILESFHHVNQFLTTCTMPKPENGKGRQMATPSTRFERRKKGRMSK